MKTNESGTVMFRIIVRLGITLILLYINKSYLDILYELKKKSYPIA